MALVAASALGVGVSGTMLWMESRKAPPVAAPTTTGSLSPQVSMPQAPVPPSTAGLSKGQAAVVQGNHFYDSQQWPQAIEQYRFAIASGIDNPNVRTDMGNCLRFAGQPQKALEQYKIAQKQDANHEQSLFNQGGLWAFSLNDRGKAIKAWQAYLKRFPNGQSAEAARQFLAQYS